jgi:hypothetical protein
MAVYADYVFYSTSFLGTAIASADFSRLALRASTQIDRLTFNRAAAVVAEDENDTTINLIKMATCAVAEELQKDIDSGGADAVTSERGGNYSVNYSEKAQMAMSLKEKIFDAAALYLENTGLMFRGFLDGE